MNDILIKSGKKALSEVLHNTIKPEEYKKMCDKGNNVLVPNKDVPGDYKMDSSIKETNFMDNLKNNELMKSSLVERLKDESINQTIKYINLDNELIKTGKAPIIPQKEMEKEL